MKLTRPVGPVSVPVRQTLAAAPVHREPPVERAPTHAQLFEPAPSAFPARPAAPLGTFGPAASAASGKYSAWVGEQMSSNASFRAIAEGVGQRLLVRQPETVRELFAVAREESARVLGATGQLGAVGEAGPHLVMLGALFALSAHAFTQDGAVRARFPRFLSDGRELTQERNAGEGIDKAWHFVNHALFTYVTLFDAHFGDGQTTAAFAQGVAAYDPEATGPRLAEVYEATGGRVGGLAPLSLPGPHEDTPVFFKRPQDLSPAEAAAYDAAVRIGDAYEVWSTRLFPQYAPSDLSSLRRDGTVTDPLAKLDDTRLVHSGVADVGVTRDLTANRVGADFGLRLFRDATKIPTIPFDEGRRFSLRPFAPGAKGPLSAFLAQEGALLGRLGVDGGVRPSDGREGTDALIAQMHLAVDQLAASQRDALSRYYASFAVRVLSLGVFYGEGPGESPHFDDHQRWAMMASPEDLKAELTRRVHEIARAHSLKDLQGLITQRAMFDPSVGRLSGQTVGVGTGAVQTVNGPNYFSGGARLVANPELNAAFVVMRGFLQVWERNDLPEAPGRFMYDVLGLPTSDEVSDGADGARQTFQRGTLNWNPRDGVKISLGQG